MSYESLNKNIEEKYKIFFKNSPAALLEEDFTEVKRYIVNLKNKGIKNLNKYFEDNINRVISCIKLIKLIDANRAALNLFQAKSKSGFKKNFNKIFFKDSYEACKKEIIAIAGDEKKFENESANQTLKGNFIYVFKKGVILSDHEKNIITVLVSLINITNLKKTEEKKNKSEIKYHSLFQDTIDGIYISTLDGKYIDVNQALVKILGYDSKEELLSINIPKQLYVSEKDRPPPNKRTKPFETRLKKKNGTIIWVEISSKVIYDGDVPVHYQGIVRDITARKEAEEEIKYLSFHDKLTGLYNRAYFEEELKRLDTKRQLPLSIVVGDANGLKMINDAFGHDRGDELLIKIAKIFKNCFRDDDIISRWGGDEFIIILPSTNIENASRIIRRIRDKCKKRSTPSLPISISLGTSAKISTSTDINRVIKEAEDRMYRDKLTDRQDIDNSIIYSLKKALDENNYETDQHIARIRNNAVKLGNELNLSKDILDELDLLATLHDIGKIAIADMIISKPGKLNAEEWEEVKRHAEIGYRIIQSSLKLAPIAKGILHHHENWDGGGYPTGLKKDKIPLTSRIISIVDAYDAMTNDRPYRKAINKEDALIELKKNSGVQFDPHLVEKFIDILEK